MDTVKPIPLYTVYIDSELMDRIEYYYYMKESYSYILEKILLKKDEYEYRLDIYEKFKEDYTNAYIQFNLISAQILKENCPQYSSEREYYKEYDFFKSTLSVYDMNDFNNSCKCYCKKEGDL